MTEHHDAVHPDGEPTPAPRAQRLASRLNRVFPGADPRWFGLLLLATTLLAVHYASAWKYVVPTWFERGATGLGFVGRDFSRQLWSHAQASLWLLLIPLLVLRVWKRTSPLELGLGLGTARREWLWVLGLYLLLLPALLVASELPSFQRVYPRLAAIRNDATLFFVYHGIYLVKWVSWEFFFRGFLLFGLHPYLKGNAVVISCLAFTLLHIPKPSLELYGALPAGLVLCWLALRGKSIWPGVVLHWLVAMTMDGLGCHWWR